jgi:hypothetical protein
MGEWNFRTAVGKDKPALLALINSAYRGEVSMLGWTTEAHLIAGEQRTFTGEDDLQIFGLRQRSRRVSERALEGFQGAFRILGHASRSIDHPGRRVKQGITKQGTLTLRRGSPG